MLLLALKAHLLLPPEYPKQLLNERPLPLAHICHHLPHTVTVHQHGQVKLPRRGCDVGEEGLTRVVLVVL